MLYQLIRNPIELIEYNPDQYRRNSTGQHDTRVVRTNDNETLLLEVAGQLNSNPLLNEFSRFIVQSCDDPMPMGVCNLSNLSQIEVDLLYLEFIRDEQWLEDVRDGLELHTNYERFNLDIDGAIWNDRYVRDDVRLVEHIKLSVFIEESNDIVLSPHQKVIAGELERRALGKWSILDCLPSYSKIKGKGDN